MTVVAPTITTRTTTATTIVPATTIEANTYIFGAPWGCLFASSNKDDQ